MDSPEENYTATEKAAYISFRLAQGETFTTKEVAEMFGTTYHCAYMTLTRISRVLPITTEEPRGGRWQRIK